MSEVHVLHEGRPLCGFSNDVPANWPGGHLWVGIKDVEDSTCAGCKSKAQELKSQSKS